jgi:site-specific recombinase XerC
MKQHTTAIIAFLIFPLLLVSCRTHPSLPNAQAGQLRSLPVYNTAGDLPTAADSLKNDSLLTRLCTLENAVYASPLDLSKISPLLKASFDSLSGCFIVAGKGTQNKSMPEASWKQGQKIASAYDAKRWALYLKSWSLGNTAHFGTKISGEITYSRILLERLDGDTLYTLVSVPMGSIIEK